MEFRGEGERERNAVDRVPGSRWQKAAGPRSEYRQDAGKHRVRKAGAGRRHCWPGCSGAEAGEQQHAMTEWQRKTRWHGQGQPPEQAWHSCRQQMQAREGGQWRPGAQAPRMRGSASSSAPSNPAHGRDGALPRQGSPRQRWRAMLSGAVTALMLAARPGVETGWARASDGLGSVTNLPVPRYVSLRSDRINVRRGPGLDYRKDWVFRRAGLPVKIIDEYGDWRRIVDMDQAGGWVYHAMLTGRRTGVVIADEAVLRTQPSDAGPARPPAEQGVVARLHSCRPDGCRIESGGYRGWVEKAAIWGVEPDEVMGD